MSPRANPVPACARKGHKGTYGPPGKSQHEHTSARPPGRSGRPSSPTPRVGRRPKLMTTSSTSKSGSKACSMQPQSHTRSIVPATFHPSPTIRCCDHWPTAADLVGIALVDLAEHAMLHKIWITWRRLARGCTSARTVVVCLQDHSLLLRLSHCELARLHESRWIPPVPVVWMPKAPTSAGRIGRRRVPRGCNGRV